MGARVRVEIAIAHPDRQRVLSCEVAPGTSIGEVLELARHELGADAPLAGAPVGVWGVLADRARPVVAGDRIELYRPLPADPKDTRRRLARQGRTMGRDGRR